MIVLFLNSTISDMLSKYTRFFLLFPSRLHDLVPCKKGIFEASVVDGSRLDNTTVNSPKSSVLLLSGSIFNVYKEAS